jgi:glycosyltransferase involved in cell wall biosynthesis
MAAADGVLCLLDPGNENNVIGTPNRMFEAMAVGVPSVVTKGTLSGDMVTEAGCGIAIDWSLASFRELVELLEDGELMNGMGENGRRAAEAQYNWEEMRSRLVRAYSLLQLRP